MNISDCLKSKHKYYNEFMFGKRSVDFDINLILDIWKENMKFFTDKDKKIGLYIHIPYCKNICYFCDCFSRLGSKKEIEIYTDFLISEIKKFVPVFKKINFDTLYFGGGTPSILSENYLNKILNVIFSNFNLVKAHSSFEGCPQTLTDKKLKILKKFNITRLTIGIQSFDKQVLKLNNRIFASDLLIKYLVERCKKYGILVNLELICGLKGQSQESFLSDVEKVVAINPSQIHLYYLVYNPATLMWYQRRYNSLAIKKVIKWREKGLKLLNNYKFYPYSGPVDQFRAINQQIYNNRINNGSLVGIGDGAISNINDNFRYGSIIEEGRFVYKKLLKRFIKYSEVFNYK